MKNPATTYRIQFNHQFTFADLRNILPYLKQLGITTIYASPVFEAVPGSVHGYDITDPTKINPEIGTLEELLELSSELKKWNMQWLQDIVPNHMAFHSNNHWLMDVLEKGQLSAYAHFFDINWSDDPEGKLMVPFLGSDLDTVIHNKELQVVFENGFKLKYYESRFPVHLKSYTYILQQTAASEAIQELLRQLNEMDEKNSDVHKVDEIRLQLSAWMKHRTVANAIHSIMDAINEDSRALQELAAQQIYRLCHWQETDAQINYRRFFTINGLICLNIQDKDVLQQHHSLVRQLVEQKVFDGLRIDHIDGLFNPEKYIDDLREAVGRDTYIVVEKILGTEEQLPQSWKIQGSTGYDFLAVANNILINSSGLQKLFPFYEQLIQANKPVADQVHEKKRLILQQHMAGELENLFQLLLGSGIADENRLAAIGKEHMKKAIGEVLVYCPVYRFYGHTFPLADEERNALTDLFTQIQNEQPTLADAIHLLKTLLLENKSDDQIKNKVCYFYQRLMQFSGPLMAKGVEDTLMYTYNALLAQNEVGDHISPESLTTDAFHSRMIHRQQQWPMALNATATHDTKRGEDARARLLVLSDLADEWIEKVKEWRSKNGHLKNGGHPDANDEYLLYQALVAHYTPEAEDNETFRTRLHAYLEKVVREAKVHSNWTTPDEAYESSFKSFADHLIASEEFKRDLQAFIERIEDHSIVNALNQTILKFTCPGVPDVYQGTELPDHSFVDPDNRRAVDFDKRLDLLRHSGQCAPGTLWDKRKTGLVKLFLTRQLSNLRKAHSSLFSEGAYIPLQVTGTYRDHILAFARKGKERAYIIVIPLHTAAICDAGDLASFDWKDTTVVPEDSLKGEFTSIFNHATLTGPLDVNALFREFPFNILESVSVKKRGAGILLSITSLPSSYGIGDTGPEARRFVDFLSAHGQKYWQVLPMNPTEAGQGHSPYSATSGMAGNPLLISIDWLIEQNLLGADQVISLPAEAHVNFAATEKAKYAMLHEAYLQFLSSDHPLKNDFAAFCTGEDGWLKDYAAYALLKKLHDNKPWYEWDEVYKFRKEAMWPVLEKHHSETNEIKWYQFIFFQQWHQLKHYCHSKHIHIIGDLPIYVSYDSADVWSHRSLFAIDQQGNRSGIAGVPPDAFSDDGQLWGMPVYNWTEMKAQHYQWWIQRMKKNLELFDLVRIDHFRALQAYWEVPPGEKTAKNGKWVAGPGADFFLSIKNHLGRLPFLAEDLGDVDEAVFSLRDQFDLPGMKVLQFAFDASMPASPHIPHNYVQNAVVFTGTHDNNTSRGWFRCETDVQVRQNLQKYLSTTVDETNIAAALIRAAYASVADIAVIPLQDILNMDENARMNKPSSPEGNWTWRLSPGTLVDLQLPLKEWIDIYNR